MPGGSALFHAGQRRTTAERLTLEANWLETIAADQASMAQSLSRLPVAYAVLHDLNVPGSAGTVDHVVVGPGGAFLVVSRRYGEHIDYRGDQLWAGDRSMKSVIDGAKVEAVAMTKALGTPVVPMLVLLGTMLPAATPTVLDGVLVSSDDNVVRAITRAPHTLLGPDKVDAITRRAMPMLHTPSYVHRGSGDGSRMPVLQPTPAQPTPVLRSAAGAPAPSAGKPSRAERRKERSR